MIKYSSFSFSFIWTLPWYIRWNYPKFQSLKIATCLVVLTIINWTNNYLLLIKDNYRWGSTTDSSLIWRQAWTIRCKQLNTQLYFQNSRKYSFKRRTENNWRCILFVGIFLILFKEVYKWRYMCTVYEYSQEIIGSESFI